jgi:hypothetical protein
MVPDLFDLCVPLEAQETSYFADSARIFNFSKIFSGIILPIQLGRFPENLK